MMKLFDFFFSSRRRHTRWPRDWSSDVCSSDLDDYEKLEGFIDKNTKAIFCESIGNPAGNVVDIQRLAEIGRRHGVPVIVDNTVATPYLCRPFELGADIRSEEHTSELQSRGHLVC